MKSLDWSNERYVRLYTRDTPEWIALGWDGQACYVMILRILDYAGMMDTSDVEAWEAVWLRLASWPRGVVESGVGKLLEHGWLVHSRKHQVLCDPEFINRETARRRSPGSSSSRRWKLLRAAIEAADSPLTDEEWLEILASHEFRCAYCRRCVKDDPTKDHVTPVVEGGTHEASNIVPACRSCNSRKGARPVDVFLAELHGAPQ